MKSNILDLIGNTPLVKLNKTASFTGAQVYAKLEFFNPGLSTKDRIVWRIVEDAESKGLIGKGGTLVEATSGNTGISIAVIAGLRGYKCILCVKDTITEAKHSLLKSMGAELVLCPSDVPPDDPRSYYSKAKEIAGQMPGAFYVNQNFNPLNTQAHYETTGKEIWQQTAGKITHLISACSTGGTISGTGKYLKEQNPDVRIIGVDTRSSLLKFYHEHGYLEKNKKYKADVVGVGKNIITGNLDLDVIDEFVYVDRESSIAYAKELMRSDGIWAGHSSGAVLQGLFEIKDRLDKDALVVLIFSDHGSRYLSGSGKNAKVQSNGIYENII